MRIDIHVHNHNDLDVDLLKYIIKQLKQVATKIDFDQLRDEINASLVNIGEDITRLTEQLASGLTSEEETAVLSEFREVAARIKLVADRTADPTNGAV